MKAFQVLCSRMNINPFALIFLYYYQIRFGDLIGWISLSGLNNRGIIGAYKSSYKHFKGEFFKVKPVEGCSHLFFDQQGKPHFPLY